MAEARPRQSWLFFLFNKNAPLWQRASASFALLMVLVMIGGGLFMLAEYENEVKSIEAFQAKRAELMAEVAEALPVQGANRTRVLSLFRELEALVSSSGSASDNSTLNWDFAGSTFFALTVSSTIGYGSYTPQTDEGKLVTVLYGTVGIFVMGLVLSVFAEVWSSLIDVMAKRRALAQARKAVAAKAAVVGWREAAPGSEDAEVQRLQGVFMSRARIWAAVCFGILMLLVGSVVFHLTEDWGYGNALYATWVTASTCGFGDFTPARKNVFSYFFILMCLALFASIIDSLQTSAEDRAAAAGPPRPRESAEQEKEPQPSSPFPPPRPQPPLSPQHGTEVRDASPTMQLPPGVPDAALQ